MSDTYRTSLLAWYVAFCRAQRHDVAYAHDTFIDFLDLVEEREGLSADTTGYAALKFFEARRRVAARLIHGPARALAHR